MKKIKSLIIGTAAIFAFASCELVDVLDQQPLNNLVPENVIGNEADAIAMLNGVYSSIIAYSNSYYYMYTELIPSAMAGTMTLGAVAGHVQFAENRLLSDNTYVNGFWISMYNVLNAANNTIALVGERPEDFFEKRTKVDILGEAHFLRAMAHFDLLRYFGEFYDMDSRYGIIIRTEPANFVKRSKARNTVVDCYEQILEDLDYAIANAPDFTVTYRASKTAAKALKARVLLFAGRHAEAAALANKVINEGEPRVRTLEPTFTAVFDKGLTSTETIFMTHRHQNSDTEDNNRKRFYTGLAAGTGWVSQYMDGDPRKDVSYSGTVVRKVNHVSTFRPTHFLRLAEMYLIEAEGLAFSGAEPDDIKIPLDAVRTRAGLGGSTATTLDEIKDDIFAEWVREMLFENGCEWFAAIRFDKIMSLKPSIIRKSQYILPIPDAEIEGNGDLTLGDQNPEYM